MKTTTCLLIIFLGGMLCNCIAVEPYQPVTIDPVLEPWRWREVDILNGLGVRCMTEAPDGTLWFGCIEKIAHYDGWKLTQIPLDNEQIFKPTPGSFRAVDSMTILKDGSVLAAVGTTIVRWADGEWTLVLDGSRTRKRYVQLVQSEHGDVWFRDRKNLWYLDRDLEKKRCIADSSAGEFLTAFCLDQNNAWVIRTKPNQSADLIRIPVKDGIVSEEANWEITPVDVKAPGRIVSIAAEPNGTIWYADEKCENGIKIFDPRQKKWTDLMPSETGHRYSSIVQNHDGTFWAAGKDDFLARTRDGSLRTYDTGILDFPRVRLSLYSISDNKLWLIGENGQVFRLDTGDDRWQTYVPLHFCGETAEGVQWFLQSRRYAVSHDTKSGIWLRYGVEDGFIENPIRIYVSRAGMVWVIGKHQGQVAVALFDGSVWKQLAHSGDVGSLYKNAICETADGVIWIGVHGQLLRYKADENSSFHLAAHQDLPDMPVNIKWVSPASEDSVWYGQSLFREYDPVLKQSKEAPALHGFAVNASMVDREKRLWVAESDLGIYRLEQDAWRELSDPDALAGEQICDLLELMDGTVLAASNKGISRFDGSTWTRHVFSDAFAMFPGSGFMRQSADGAIWINLYQADLRSLETRLRIKKGYYTTRYRLDTNPPKTRIDEHLQQVARTGNIYISWSARDYMDDTSPNELQYSWRLDGGAWSSFSSDTGRTFVNLESGNHTLKVRARDRDFNIDPSPARTRLSVAFPIWRQAWFVILVLLVTGGAVTFIWMLIYYRAKRLKDRAQHLVEIDALKTGFFTNISHELRTPVTVIQGPLQALLANERDGQKKKALTMMERNVNRIYMLINQLLDFRKIQENKLKLTITEGELTQAVGDLAASLQPLAESKGVSCSLSALTPCQAWFDPDKLEKILTNLMSNAIKYTPSGGAIYITMQIDDDEQGHRWAELSVEDTGSGIDPEHLSHIFERFYRIPEQLITDGSGIGLNLTQELVHLWGGTICVESPIHDDAERPGTRFTVRLPIDRENMPPEAIATDTVPEAKPSGILREEMQNVPHPEMYEDPSGSSLLDVDGRDKPLLLVVEDDQDIRTFITEGLSPFYRVEEATDGAKGLEMARNLFPALVVTDLMMPIMDGIELCRILKTDLKTSHIPVIMLTAKGSLDHQVEGLQTGADDYITKPFHMILLQARIANLLESRRVLRERFSQDFMISEQSVPENSPDKTFMKNVFDVLEDNHSDPEFLVDEFARAMHMSSRTLQRKLKVLTGDTPAKLIWNFRLKKAAQLLKTTTMMVSEIAYEVGYGEHSHFSHQFKQLYGMNPSAYRNSNR